MTKNKNKTQNDISIEILQALSQLPKDKMGEGMELANKAIEHKIQMDNEFLKLEQQNMRYKNRNQIIMLLVVVMYIAFCCFLAYIGEYLYLTILLIGIIIFVSARQIYIGSIFSVGS